MNLPVSIQDIADTKYSLDMRGDHNWSTRVGLLRKILKLAALRDTSEPMYKFGPYYFCRNGMWYRSTHQTFGGAVDVLDVDLPQEEVDDRSTETG